MERMEINIRAALSDMWEAIQTSGLAYTSKPTVKLTAAAAFEKGEITLVPYTNVVVSAPKGSYKASAYLRDRIQLTGEAYTVDGVTSDVFLRQPKTDTNFIVPFWTLFGNQHTLLDKPMNMTLKKAKTQ